MGDLSFKSIRSAFVTTGNAANYHSMGLAGFDEDATVNPDRASVSDSGVFNVARDSINTLAPGFNPLDRMDVENIQRPRYSTYLNANAINVPGVGDNDLLEADQRNQTRSAYDTELGYQYVRNQVTNPPVYKLNQFRPRSGQMTAEEKDKLKVNCMMLGNGSQYLCDPYAQ